MPETQNQHPHTKITYAILGLSCLLLIGSTTYFYMQNNSHVDELSALSQKYALAQAENNLLAETLRQEQELASSTIHELSERLSLTTEELEDIERDLRREKDKNDEFEDQIKDLAGTVSVLDKLSKTDKELLQKYSRTYFLNENFMPLKLSLIDDKYLMNPDKDAYFHAEAVDFLEDMLDAAKRAGHDIKIISAFRSFDEQRAVKANHEVVYGTGANAFSADQGYSEHQLGTTVDIVDTVTRTTSEAFANTEAYAWLLKNAHRYGFVLSYPEGNQFYIFEPWHWRFVGRSLAEDLYDDNQTFYDLEQRELDAYLIKIFD